MRTEKTLSSYGSILAFCLALIATLALSSSSYAQSWKEKLEKTVAAAKEKNTVVVSSSAGQQIRQVMT